MSLHLKGLGAALVLSACLALPALAAMADGARAAADGQVLRERALRFIPLADGREAVVEDRSNRLVKMYERGQNSFLRITIRILQQTRKHHGEDISKPFYLSLRSDDGLTLEDPLTQSHLAIRAFGEAAVAGIAPLLDAPATEVPVLHNLCPRLEC